MPPATTTATSTWSAEVDELGKCNARKLRAYVIAVNTDPAFRHVDMIQQGWSSADEGRSLTDGRIVWASFIPQLKRLGREAVEAAVAAQQQHEARIFDTSMFTYRDIKAVVDYDPTISQLARDRGWQWGCDRGGWMWSFANVRS